jgi:hypothetical protein
LTIAKVSFAVSETFRAEDSESGAIKGVEFEAPSPHETSSAWTDAGVAKDARVPVLVTDQYRAYPSPLAGAGSST